MEPFTERWHCPLRPQTGETEVKDYEAMRDDVPRTSKFEKAIQRRLQKQPQAPVPRRRRRRTVRVPGRRDRETGRFVNLQEPSAFRAQDAPYLWSMFVLLIFFEHLDCRSLKPFADVKARLGTSDPHYIGHPRPCEFQGEYHPCLRVSDSAAPVTVGSRGLTHAPPLVTHPPPSNCGG